MLVGLYDYVYGSRHTNTITPPLSLPSLTGSKQILAAFSYCSNNIRSWLRYCLTRKLLVINHFASIYTQNSMRFYSEQCFCMTVMREQWQLCAVHITRKKEWVSVSTKATQLNVTAQTYQWLTLISETLYGEQVQWFTFLTDSKAHLSNSYYQSHI